MKRFRVLYHDGCNGWRLAKETLEADVVDGVLILPPDPDCDDPDPQEAVSRNDDGLFEDGNETLYVPVD